MGRSTQSSEMRQELLAEFCEALLSVKSTSEALQFLEDLLTKAEVVMLAKRIHIAKMLLAGESYRSIERALQVSHGTVAKVGAWLEESGEGFRLVAQRTKEEKRDKKPNWSPAEEEWRRVKKRYPLMFWPQLLVEEIVRSANNRQKQQLRRAIEKIDRKSKVYQQVSKLLREESK